MGNEEVKYLDTTWAGKVTKSLIVKQKNQTKETNKVTIIKANIWNDFMKKIHKTGSDVKNGIILENAINSITKYAVVEGQKQGRSAEDVAKDWFELMGLELSSKNDETKIVDEVSESAQAKDVAEAPTAVVPDNQPAIAGNNEANKNKEAVILAPVNEHVIPSILQENKNVPEGDPFIPGSFTDRNGQPSVRKYSVDGGIIKTIHYLKDGKTVDYIEDDYTQNGIPKRFTQYTEGKVEFVNIRNDEGKLIKQENYREDESLDYINEYNPNTEHPTRVVTRTYYKQDEENCNFIDRVDHIDQYDPKVSNKVSTTEYYYYFDDDETKVSFVEEYSAELNELVRLTNYNTETGKVDYVFDYTGEEPKKIQYKEDGVTVDYVENLE